MRRPFTFLLLSALSATSAMASFEVQLVGGRTLVAANVESSAGRSILTLPGGGVISVAARRIKAVTQLEELAELRQDRPDGQDQQGQQGQQDGAARPAGEERLTPSPVLPAWDDLLMNREATGGFTELIGRAAATHGVDPELLRCVLLVESAFDSEAVSPKGAMGLAQLMPGTAAELGVEDPFDPAQSVDAAARLLAKLLAENDGRFVPALAAYNAGRGAVRRYGGVPPYGETIRYIEKILSLYHASPSR